MALIIYKIYITCDIIKYCHNICNNQKQTTHLQMSVAQVYLYTVKQVIFTKCKFSLILQEGLLCLVKVLLASAVLIVGFIVTISKCNL